MRTIQKNHEPRVLTEWRQKYKGDPNYGYELLRQDKDVLSALVTSLLDEQGHLCAYTGRPLSEVTCHIEHLKAQAHCTPQSGEDIRYDNLVACYPKPNARSKAPYGAHQKGNWPSPEEEDQFVRPTMRGCEDRFLFERKGGIAPRVGDGPANTTIGMLHLCHKELTQLRRHAIEGTLNPGRKGYLSKIQAERRLRQLEQKTGKLDPYIFAVKQALAQYITKHTR